MVARAVRFSTARLGQVVFVCAAVAFAAALVAALLGDQPISLAAAFAHQSPDADIFFSARLPRVVLAALVGAALSASGAALQGLMRNPLADPFVLGVSGGAALGATVSLALGLAATTPLALAGALGATALVMTVGRLAERGAAHTTLLAGVIFNSFALAVILFIKVMVAPDRLGEVLFWLAGKVERQSWSSLALLGATEAVAVGAIWALSGKLNLLTLGDDDAASLGVNVRRTRGALLLLASLSVAAAVSLSGLVGFVGLVIPHLARLVLGPDQRLLIPSSALLGAAFLPLADLLARLLYSVVNNEPPVGIVTALLGGPLFLLLMVRKR